MYLDDSLITHYCEGILKITSKGDILDTTPQAINLLAVTDLDNTNLFQDFLFLDYNDYTPVAIHKIISKNANYIIQINSKKKTLYISAAFKRSTDKEDYIVILNDHTDLIEKIQEFKKQEYHQRLLVSSINDIIFEVNKDGIFLNYWTNKPELLIHPPSTFIGRPLTDVLPQDISSKILKLIKNSIKEKQHNIFQYTLPITGNKQKWYSATIKNIPDQDEIVAIVITDNTKQKEYQDKLIFSEKKFYQAFHFSGIGTTLTSLEGYLIEGNNTVSEILGYTKKELRHIRSIDITHPDDKAFDLSIRKELLQGKKNYQTFLKRYLHKANYYVWCSITISLVRDNARNPQYFIVQLVDMTEFIRNNEELIVEKKKLETIKAQLESKILQNEEANHIIAHNLLSPIANIKMLIESLKETDEKEFLLNLLNSCCDELDETVADLNAIASNINYSLSNHEIEHCSFNELLDKIIEIKQPIIAKKNAIITTDFQVQQIKTQRVALYSIMDQLLDNALQFSDPERTPLIHLTTYIEQNSIVLSIQDNGLGMDLNKVKSQLFMFKKIFHRGFDTKGIGLNITKYQIDSLGGKIDVSSKPGEGTTFFVKFPII